MTGVFSLKLEQFGLSPLIIGAGRVTVAALAGAVLFGLTPRKMHTDWWVSRKDWPLLLVNGILGVSLFHFSYLSTIHQVGMGLAAILMYTKPAFVLALARCLIGESITWLKVISLGLTLSGIALVINLPEIWQTGTLQITAAGVLTGLIAGFAGGLFATLNKALMRNHPPLKVNAYNLLIGAAGLWLFAAVGELSGLQPFPAAEGAVPPGPGSTAVVWLLAMGIVTTFLPYLFYVWGLQWIGAGQANVIAGIEPVVAMIMGIMLFAEQLSPWQWVGSCLVIAAAVLVSRPEDQTQRKRQWLTKEG